MPEPSQEVTRLLEGMTSGEADAALRLMPIVYEQLREVAASYLRQHRGNRGRGHATLQPTILVHEAFLKLVGHDSAGWSGRAHFFAVAARAMRQILIDHVRSGLSRKRGGGVWQRVTLDPGLAPSDDAGELPLLELDDALLKLAALSPRQARVVELRFFGGLTVAEAGEVLGLSEATVHSDWKMARAWLSRELSGGGSSGD